MLLIDNKTLGELEYYMPDKKEASRLADFFEMFSDITRVRILSALVITEMCVSDLAELLSVNQTTLSHQLRTLRDKGVVETVRQGKVVFYKVADSVVINLLTCGAEYLFEKQADFSA